MEIIEKIKKEFDAFETKRQELTNGLRKDFPEIFKPFFEKGKSIKNISWTQYTPYFNDGDECVFSANVDYFDINYSVDENGDEVMENATKEDNEAAAELGKVLRSIPDDFYRDLFGDHVRVTIHADGSIDIEEYDHD